MRDLTAIQKRVLVAAMVGQGKIILWALKSGRWVLPGFTEDVKNAVLTLERAGLLVPRDAAGRETVVRETLAPGSYVLELTESGWSAAQEVTGRKGGTGPSAA